MIDVLLGPILLVSLVIGAVWGLAQLADWLEKRRGAETTANTNVDPHPQVADMRGSTFNINISTNDQLVVESVFDLAQTADDHGVPQPEGEAPLTGGICPFEAPPRPEL